MNSPSATRSPAAPTSPDLTRWVPEAVVVGSCLAVVGMAVGAISALPAVAMVALFGAAALASGVGQEPTAER